MLFGNLINKRGLLASFFFIAIPFNSIASVVFEELTQQQKHEFSALLHIHDGKVKIPDSQFLLADEASSLKQLFDTNLAMLMNEQTEKEFMCKFPARSIWLTRFIDKQIEFTHCADLSNYLESVSSNTISLIYASENLISPSSFMGHSFLKLSKNAEDNGHAVSFFTDVDTINIPLLLFESIVTGKEGHFIVSPYSENIVFYKDVEGRNLYEYQLDLSVKEKQLIKFHLWELKDKSIPYFFDNHNCATITLDILGIVRPELISSANSQTPLDIIKQVNQQNLISEVQIIPSNEWKIRTYSKALTAHQRQSSRLFFKNASIDKILKQITNKKEQYLVAEYLIELNKYLYSANQINKDSYKINSEKLNSIKYSIYNYQIDLSNFKNPLKRPKDSQVRLATTYNKNRQNSLDFSWLPASHLLLDDNRNSYSESSLELLKISGSLNKESLRLQQFKLYGFRSYIPYHTDVGGISGKFSLSWNRETLNDFETPRFEVTAGAGLSYEPVASTLLYSTIGAKLATDIKKTWLIPEIESGAFLYLKHKTKLHFNHNVSHNFYNFQEVRHKFSITGTYFGLVDNAFDLKVSFIKYKKLNETQISLSYRYYY